MQNVWKGVMNIEGSNDPHIAFKKRPSIKRSDEEEEEGGYLECDCNKHNRKKTCALN